MILGELKLFTALFSLWTAHVCSGETATLATTMAQALSAWLNAWPGSRASFLRLLFSHSGLLRFSNQPTPWPIMIISHCRWLCTYSLWRLLALHIFVKEKKKKQSCYTTFWISVHWRVPCDCRPIVKYKKPKTKITILSSTYQVLVSVNHYVSGFSCYCKTRIKFRYKLSGWMLKLIQEAALFHHPRMKTFVFI